MMSLLLPVAAHLEDTDVFRSKFLVLEFLATTRPETLLERSHGEGRSIAEHEIPAIVRDCQLRLRRNAK